MFYSLIIDANGNGIGNHDYETAPDSLPPDEIPCTADQAANMALWKAANGVLVENLSAVQTAQVAVLRAACGAEIVAGFASQALGVSHTYPSQATDQTNLIGAVTASQSPSAGPGWACNFWCEDGGGTWAFVSHTAAQIQQVLADGVTAREALSSKLATLTAEVMAATTAAAVRAVVW